MMEVVLTRLRDFSCKTATFEDCKPARLSVCRDPRTSDLPQEGARVNVSGARDCSPHNMDIESALAWLRRELMEMRSQDQALVKQLMDLHTGIQELKQELSEEEPEEEEEENYWDSESEARGSSSLCSSSGEFEFSIPCGRVGPSHTPGSLSKSLLSRRSSVP